MGVGVGGAESSYCLNLYLFLFTRPHQVLVVALGIFNLSCSVWDLVPRPGTKPSPLHWEGVSATGPAGKPSNHIIKGLQGRAKCQEDSNICSLRSGQLHDG